MRRWPLVVALVLIASPLPGQDGPVLGGLASQPGWAGFAVVGGRLAILDTPPRFEKRTDCADAEGRTGESICIKSAGEAAVVQYEFFSPQEQFRVEAEGSQRVEIHRLPQGDASLAELHFIQIAGRDLIVSIGAGSARREFSAPTFWRLLLAEPELMADSVVPLLEALRPDWGLLHQAAAIEAQLYDLAETAPAPQAERWDALVAQLSDPRFARRQAADRELRAAGQSLLPYLLQLDRRRLDAEQRARLAAIRRSFVSLGEDTPSRVASQMLYDRGAWLDLLARDDVAQRTAAARRLGKICPQAAAFDPQADREIRRVQLEQLRQQLARD